MFMYFLLQHMNANLKSGFWLAREAEPYLEKTKYFEYFWIVFMYLLESFRSYSCSFYVHHKDFECWKERVKSVRIRSFSDPLFPAFGLSTERYKVSKQLSISAISSINIKTEVVTLKGQPCKLCNNKHMIASTQITNSEIFAFIAVLVFKLLSHKGLFIN